MEKRVEIEGWGGEMRSILRIYGGKKWRAVATWEESNMGS